MKRLSPAPARRTQRFDFGWPICILLFVLAMWPWDARTPDVRSFTAPLAIQGAKTSAAFAAREDVDLPAIQEFPKDKLQLRKGQIFLHSGSGTLDPKIFKTPAPTSSLLAHNLKIYKSAGMTVRSFSTEPVRMQMQAMVFSRHDSDASDASQSGFSKASSGKIHFVKATGPRFDGPDFNVSRADPLESRTQFINQLPENLKARAENTPDLAQALAQNYASAGSSALESKITALWSASAPQEGPYANAWVHSVDHQQRGSRNPATQMALPLPQPSVTFALPQPIAANSSGAEPPPQPNLGKAHAQVHSLAEASGATSPAPTADISGAIELKDGLAFFGSQSGLTVTQRIAGQDVARGTLSIATGKYTMHLNPKNEGELVAELRSPAGLLMGRVSRSLASQPSAEMNLSVVPLSALAIGSVQGSTIQTAEVIIEGLGAGIRTDAQGRFKKAGFIKDSSYLIAARQPGFATTVALATVDHAEAIQLFPNQIVNTWINQMMNPSNARSVGSIYGKVSNVGVGLLGSTVEVDDAHAKVLYLDSDRNVTNNPMTDLSGSFAVVGMQPGLHLMGALLSSGQRIVRTVVVEAGSISTVEMSPAGKKPMTTFIYDSQTGAALPTRVSLNGEDKAGFAEAGQLRLNIQQDDSYVDLGFDSGPAYVPANRLCSRGLANVNVPMLRKDWLQEAEDQAGVSREPGQGYIVGFVRGDGFTLNEASLKLNLNSRVIYFDSAGKLIPNPMAQVNKAVAGFVILNVPRGVHTVGVQLTGHAEIGSQVVSVQGSEVSVLEWSL